MPDPGSRKTISVVLALDFGTRRIGIASGDTLTRSAHPRGAIANGPGGPDWAALKKHLDDLRPARLAVGEPYNADGSGGGTVRGWAPGGTPTPPRQRGHSMTSLAWAREAVSRRSQNGQ